MMLALLYINKTTCVNAWIGYLRPPRGVCSDVLTKSQQLSIIKVTIDIRVLKVYIAWNLKSVAIHYPWCPSTDTFNTLISMVTLIIDSCCDFVKTSEWTPRGGLKEQ